MASDDRWMIYGAYGYSGQLIARRAQAQGLAPVLAGRNEARLRRLAAELSLPYRCFTLGEAAGALDGVDLVLHCAGPYSETSRPMVDACIRRKAHYLDLTGELDVMEAVYARDAEARRAGIVLMPSVGFGVVATDCLAVKLQQALPDASRLEIAISGGMNASPGTAKTAVEGLLQGIRVRRDGRLTILDKPVARQARFGGEQRTVTSVPWADLSSAFRSTGIGDITAYMEITPSAARAGRLLPLLAPLLALGPVQDFLKRLAEKWATGPTAEQRAAGGAHVWGFVENASGAYVEGSLETPEPYDFTAIAALECVLRVLRGAAEPGAFSPAGALGSDLVTRLHGVGQFKIEHGSHGQGAAEMHGPKTADR